MVKLYTLPAVLLLLLYSNILLAQGNIIYGTVTDSAGNAIAHASIRAKANGKGAAANEQGAFSIKAATGDVLVISSTGYDDKEVVVNGDVLQITLQSNSNLQPVIITALGIKRSRNALPYAAQQISGDDVNKTHSTNFVNNLSGKIAGLQISASNALGGSANVILRGYKSLTQSN